MRILVIDDESSVRAVLSMMLTLNGHEVAEAEHGREGLALALALAPDLVITDLGMPEMDGYEVLTALQTAPRSRHIPVLILSGRVEPAARARALELGARDFLTKPFTEEQLLSAVRRSSQLHAPV